jgi:hypothetical protein
MTIDAPIGSSLDAISERSLLVGTTRIPARCRDRPAAREANLPLLDGKEVF